MNSPYPPPDAGGFRQNSPYFPQNSYPSQPPRQRRPLWKTALLVLCWPVGLVVLLRWLWGSSGLSRNASIAITSLLAVMAIWTTVLTITLPRSEPVPPASSTAEVTSAAAEPSSAPSATLPPHSQAVSAADYGAPWPVAVDHGVISCRDDSAVLFTAPDGVVYTINGSAMTYYPELPHIRAIWLDDPTSDDPDILIYIGGFIDLGLSLC